MKKIIAISAVCVLLSGCATPGDMWEGFAGVSTKAIEETRPNALVKVFDYDYKTCYAKVRDVLERMPKVSIYAEKVSTATEYEGMIAVYLIDPNTTPVGIFLSKVDPTHTKVEVSSESTHAKEWVAKNIFSGKVIKAEPVKKF